MCSDVMCCDLIWCHSIHKYLPVAYKNGGNKGADDSVHQDGEDVVEEVGLLERVARIQNDGRQDDKEENLGLEHNEQRLLVLVSLVKQVHDQPDEEAEDHGYS